MWIMIWVLLAAFVVGVYIWTTTILFEQKKAWKSFAEKSKLTYAPGKLTEPPSIIGTINGRRVSFFTNIQPTADVRGQRQMTAIEIGLGSGMPTAAALATSQYAGFLSSIRMNETFVPDSPDWKAEYLIRTRDVEALRAYLTPERLKALQSVFGMKNSMALFFFDEVDAVLRLETTDPLRNVDRMAKMMKSLMATLDRLAPTEDERQKGAFRATEIQREQMEQEAAAKAAAAKAAAEKAAAEKAATEKAAAEAPAAPMKKSQDSGKTEK